jgi:hypothetical protein
MSLPPCEWITVLHFSVKRPLAPPICVKLIFHAINNLIWTQILEYWGNTIVWMGLASLQRL